MRCWNSCAPHPPCPDERGPRGQAAARDAGRGDVRRRVARTLRHRCVDLPGHASRRDGAQAGTGHRDGDRHRARTEGAGPRARCWHQSVRPDHRQCAGDRYLDALPAAARHRSGAPYRDRGAGNRARSPQRAAASTRAVVPGRRLDWRAGHARRHGRQQLLWLTLDRLRQHGAQRARRRGVAVRWDLGRVRSAADAQAARAAHRCIRARAGAAPRGRDRGALAKGAASRCGLQPRYLPSPERASLHQRRQRQSRASAHRRRGYAGLHQVADVAARAPAALQRARRRQFSELPRCHERGPAPRRARAHCDRAGRSHHDRAESRQPRVRACDPARADR